MLAKFSGVEPERTASKFTGLFTHSIKLSREMRKIHVAVVQRFLRNVQKSVMHVQSCSAYINPLFFFTVFVAFAVTLVVAKAPYCCDPKIWYHSNVTSHFSSLLNVFCLSPVTVPDVFAKAYSAQFPSRFLSCE